MLLEKMLLKPRKLYKIGEVMRFSGLTRQTIHNYTCMGLITEEERTDSNHRLYSEDVFDTLSEIDQLKSDNTLLEIRRIFESRDPVTSRESQVLDV